MSTSAFSIDPQAEIDGRRLLQVEHKRPFPAIHGRVGNPEEFSSAGPLDAQHICAEVGKQHPAIGGWAEPREFEHADTRQRSIFGCRCFHGSDRSTSCHGRA